MSGDGPSSRRPELDLSVIIPCYNVAETLGDQLAALAAEEWSGAWEVVVVDNGSTDETAAVAHSSTLGQKLRVVTAVDGQSVAYARNAGVRASRATSVAFCDGDDIIRPGWVAAMGGALESSQLVTGAVDPTRINEPWLAATRPSSSADALPHFGQHPFARGNNCGMRRELWERLSGFDEQFRGLEDIELSLRAAAINTPPTFVPASVVDYRYRPGLAALWNQGFFYGRGRRELSRRARQMGLAAPSRFAGAKSWVWLIARLPQLHTRSGRYAWVWVLANRVGSLAGLLSRPQAFSLRPGSTANPANKHHEGGVS